MISYECNTDEMLVDYTFEGAIERDLTNFKVNKLTNPLTYTCQNRKGQKRTIVAPKINDNRNLPERTKILTFQSGECEKGAESITFRSNLNTTNGTFPIHAMYTKCVGESLPNIPVGVPDAINFNLGEDILRGGAVYNTGSVVDADIGFSGSAIEISCPTGFYVNGFKMPGVNDGSGYLLSITNPGLLNTGSDDYPGPTFTCKSLYGDKILFPTVPSVPGVPNVPSVTLTTNSTTEQGGFLNITTLFFTLVVVIFLFFFTNL